MKKSHTPTRHILVRAYTGSEWDSCDFAIITISQGWKEQQAQRLKVLDNIENDDCFLSVNYRDTFVDFYKTTQLKLSEEPTPNLESLLGDADWTFVELEQEEQEQFSVPQSTLNCYKISFERLGFFSYKANGKHTSEEFWTAEIDLKEILTN
ncbi:hypothetical protein ACQ1PL_04470 [Ornithobacterium rhinotracheale]